MKVIPIPRHSIATAHCFCSLFFQNQKEANHNLSHSIHRLIRPAKTQPIAAWRCLARILFLLRLQKKVFSRKHSSISKQQVISIACDHLANVCPLCVLVVRVVPPVILLNTKWNNMEKRERRIKKIKECRCVKKKWNQKPNKPLSFNTKSIHVWAFGKADEWLFYLLFATLSAWVP